MKWLVTIENPVVGSPPSFTYTSVPLVSQHFDLAFLAHLHEARELRLLKLFITIRDALLKLGNNTYEMLRIESQLVQDIFVY